MPMGQQNVSQGVPPFHNPPHRPSNDVASRMFVGGGPSNDVTPFAQDPPLPVCWWGPVE